MQGCRVLEIIAQAKFCCGIEVRHFLRGPPHSTRPLIHILNNSVGTRGTSSTIEVAFSSEIVSVFRMMGSLTPNRRTINRLDYSVKVLVGY